MKSLHNPFCRKWTQKLSTRDRLQRFSSRQKTNRLDLGENNDLHRFPFVRDGKREYCLCSWTTERIRRIKRALVWTRQDTSVPIGKPVNTRFQIFSAVWECTMTHHNSTAQLIKNTCNLNLSDVWTANSQKYQPENCFRFLGWTVTVDIVAHNLTSLCIGIQTCSEVCIILTTSEIQHTYISWCKSHNFLNILHSWAFWIDIFSD